MTKSSTALSKPTKTSNHMLSLITKKLNSDKRANRPDPFYQLSSKHQGSPSSSSEEEHASARAERKEEQPSDNEEVSQELNVDGESEKDADEGGN